MIAKLEKILKRWDSTLRENKWCGIKNEDMNVLCAFIRENSSKDKLVKQVIDCRNYCIYSDMKTEQLLTLTRRALKTIKRRYHRTYSQSEMYKSVTRHLFSEQIKKVDGRPLRTLDVEVEKPATARFVRRYVEKRMGQEYHRQHKKDDAFRTNNKARHSVNRAISYQLHNIGQVETGERRTFSTHWKPIYDPFTGTTVLKKKMSYSTLKEAKMAIIQWHADHPEDNIPMQAYKCEHCHNYHIGHNRELKPVI